MLIEEVFYFIHPDFFNFDGLFAMIVVEHSKDFKSLNFILVSLFHFEWLVIEVFVVHQAFYFKV